MKELGSPLRVLNYGEAIEFFGRDKNRVQLDSSLDSTVLEIINAVVSDGDAAVLRYTSKFDGFSPEDRSLTVPKSDIENSENKISSTLKSAVDLAYNRILSYHEKQKQGSYFIKEGDSILGQTVNPLESVGLYVPGGKASYPSTLLMNAIPAKVAGVKRIVVFTPPNSEGFIDDSILYAAKLCGVSQIFRAGGAQAVAAMAYGTESVVAVDKITGPGNKFVAAAKRLVFGVVDIDMIAGPSEILVYADENNSPDIIAVDLFSQAEHDEDATVILLTESKQLIAEVGESIKRLLPEMKRKDIISSSLKNNGLAILVDSKEEAFKIINLIAPEHLEVIAKLPYQEILDSVVNAGAIFIGDYSPEAMGDYIAGPNHTLPTAGTARFASPLGVYDFIKRSSVINLDKNDFYNLADSAEVLANSEGLYAHGKSISMRRKNEKS